MSKSDISPTPAQRYLNLGGAPWSVDTPNRTITPAMRSAVIGSVMLISLSSYFTNTANSLQTLGNVGAGVLGIALAAKSSIQHRRREIEMLTAHIEGDFIIDTAPEPQDSSDPEILLRTKIFSQGYTWHHVIEAGNIVLGTAALIPAPLIGQTLSTAMNPAAGIIATLGLSFAASGGLLFGLTGHERRDQFAHMADEKWKICPVNKALLRQSLNPV